jgi:hypothetical protein
LSNVDKNLATPPKFDVLVMSLNLSCAKDIIASILGVYFYSE